MKAARKAARKTQEQIAQDCGVTKGAVSQWENDGTAPDLQKFVAFCAATRASADYLLLARGDQLVGQLVDLYSSLSQDGRDLLLLRANRMLTEEQPGPARHDPFGRMEGSVAVAREERRSRDHRGVSVFPAPARHDPEIVDLKAKRSQKKR